MVKSWQFWWNKIIIDFDSDSSVIIFTNHISEVCQYEDKVTIYYGNKEHHIDLIFKNQNDKDRFYDHLIKLKDNEMFN